MSGKQIFLHIGMPKCASSFLQADVFPLVKAVHNAQFDDEVIHKLLVEIMSSGLPELIESRAADRMAAVLAELPKDKVLVSEEMLVGNVFGAMEDPVDVAKKLKYIFPSARILFVIRRQDNFVESAYRHSLVYNSFSSPEEFLNYRNGHFGPVSHQPSIFLRRGVSALNMDVRNLNYLRVTDALLKEFDASRVTVLPFEMLKKDPKAFVAAVCTFLEEPPVEPTRSTPRNPGYSLITGKIARVLNRFVVFDANRWWLIPNRPFFDYFYARRKTSNLARRMVGVVRRISLRWLLQEVLEPLVSIPVDFVNPAIRKKALDLHSSDNQELDRRLGLGLGDHGYY